MKRPLISVIIPIYNVERYLPKCLDSVIGQTYENMEIILVDDGSPDGCGAICDEYAKRDPRVKVIHKENGGLSSARNAALDICTGEYISFIDSDDFISPYFLEIMYNGLMKYDSDIVTVRDGVDFSDETEEGVKLAENIDDCALEPIAPREAIRLMMYQRLPNGAQWRVYKRYIFDDIRFPVGWLYEDGATTHLTFMKAKRMTLVDADIYAYRHRSESIIRMKFSSEKLIAVTIGQKVIKDVTAYDPALKNAAYSRAFSANYSVFLQVPWENKEARDRLWEEIKKYRAAVLRDGDDAVRRKNKLGALTSYAGQRVSWLIGRMYKKRSG